MRVEVHGKDGCPYCVEVKTFLTEAGVPFTEILHNDDVERGRFYDELELEGGERTVPQVLLVEDDGLRHRVGGARETKLSGIESLFR